MEYALVNYAARCNTKGVVRTLYFVLCTLYYVLCTLYCVLLALGTARLLILFCRADAKTLAEKNRRREKDMELLHFNSNSDLLDLEVILSMTLLSSYHTLI